LNLIRVMPAKGSEPPLPSLLPGIASGARRELEAAMQTSAFLARMIGPLFLVLGLGMLMNRAGYRAMAGEFLASRALIYVAGLMAFLPGLAIVLTHNVWVAGWPVIVTIFGWLAMVGGVFRLLFPQQVTKIGSAMLAREGYLTVGAVVVLALGAFLTWAGFLA
jgi:hypothetical protein